MPLYRVSVSLETVVFADDADDARNIARDGLDAALDDEFREVEKIKTLDDLPFEWDADALVWHDGQEDLTVRDALARSKVDD